MASSSAENISVYVTMSFSISSLLKGFVILAIIGSVLSVIVTEKCGSKKTGCTIYGYQNSVTYGLAFQIPMTLAT